jgi:hypothetical protein
MSEKNHWTLSKIREVYDEILRSYNVLFPLHPDRRVKEGAELDGFDPGGDNFYLEIFPEKAKRILPKLKRAADQSGNAQTWRAGESLDSLSQGMRERVNVARKFGI